MKRGAGIFKAEQILEMPVRVAYYDITLYHSSSVLCCGMISVKCEMQIIGRGA